MNELHGANRKRDLILNNADDADRLKHHPYKYLTKYYPHSLGSLKKILEVIFVKDFCS